MFDEIIGKMDVIKEREKGRPDASFADLGRRTWFTLEHSLLSDPTRSGDAKERMKNIGDQTDQLAKMGIPWMAAGKWADRRTWKQSHWITFWRTWKPYVVLPFLEIVNDQEKKLLKCSENLVVSYAHRINSPHDDANAGNTWDDAVAELDAVLSDFSSNPFLGDPMASCGACETYARGFKMKRCSRCQKAHYCSIECQKRAWKQHKKDCSAPEKS